MAKLYLYCNDCKDDFIEYTKGKVTRDIPNGVLCPRCKSNNIVKS